MSGALPFHNTYFDAQDNQLVVGCYEIGVGRALVFDGGGITDPETLRSIARDMRDAADWIEAAPSAEHPTQEDA